MNISFIDQPFEKALNVLAKARNRFIKRLLLVGQVFFFGFLSGIGSRQNNWSKVIPMFAFVPEIRKAIYTTNAIVSMNMKLEKVIRNRAMFPSDDVVFKILYLALKNTSKIMDNADTELER